MKLWRDLEIGEKIELGDRCCGRDNNWIEMDERALKLHENSEGLEVDFESFPFQREVKQQDSCTITLSEDPERGDPNAG